MRTIATTTYRGKVISIEITGTNDYLGKGKERLEVRALQGEPFAWYDSEGYPHMTATAKLFPSQVEIVSDDTMEDCTCVTGYELTACPVCIANAPALELVY